MKLHVKIGVYRCMSFLRLILVEGERIFLKLKKLNNGSSDDDDYSEI